MSARRVPGPERVPVSSYRLQLHHGFTFADAAALVPYLSSLGVTDLYVSPILMANPGSTHGYDICDHSRLNPELGGDAGFETLSAALEAAGIGLIVDVVPNHMGINPRTNAWWHDVLENGPSSPYSRFFDIDWAPVKDELENRVLLPILGDQYGLALERGELRLDMSDGALELHYFEHRLPINPRQTPRVFKDGLDELTQAMGEADPDLGEFLSVMTELQNLPAYTERDPHMVAERQREKEVARRRLARLVLGAPAIRDYIDASLGAINGRAGDAASFDALHGLLEAQAYRLASWRTAFDEINYRRFFDVNELGGLRMEEAHVFEAAHARLLALVGEGRVTGLRIDHPDGLFDPARYFDELQAAAAAARDAARRPGTSLFIVAEKILSVGERIPEDWAVHGTTGYDFLNDVNGLFIDPGGLVRLGRIFARVSGRPASAAEVVYACKRLIMQTSMASELHVLAHALNRLSERDRRSRDFTLNSLRRALMEIVACFPIYRTYVKPDRASDEDRAALDAAIRAARRQNAELDPSMFRFIRRMLLPQDDDQPDAGVRVVPIEDRLAFALKFQQYTGPVQAKGLEDTAFYRHVVLLSANEVGGDPERMSRSPADLHAANQARLLERPFEFLSTTTHDTKRGEDARARLNVLSELPDEWRRHASAWIRLNARGRTLVDREWAPDRGDEYLFYQSLIGAWPNEPADALVPEVASASLVSRLETFMTKALREAKLHSSWVSENAAYERATGAYVDHALAGAGAGRFLKAFVPFVRRVADRGVVNSLAALVLKIASPGVPDFYQGSELWDTSLVDPDNRRPVDYDHRRTMLDRLEPLLSLSDAQFEAASDERDGRLVAAVIDLLARRHDGDIKLFVTAIGLRLRRRFPDLFLGGEYQPLEIHPASDPHIVGFVRRGKAGAIIALVPRLTGTLTATSGSALPVGEAVWQSRGVRLPAGLGGTDWRNVLTGEIVRPRPRGDGSALWAADAFATCPVALLWAAAQPDDPPRGPDGPASG